MATCIFLLNYPLANVLRGPNLSDKLHLGSFFLLTKNTDDKLQEFDRKLICATRIRKVVFWGVEGFGPVKQEFDRN